MARSRIAVAGLVAASCLAGLAWAQPNASVEEAIDAHCYSCHWDWEAFPMRAMYDVLPANNTRLEPEGHLALRVQHAWISTITHMESQLDLRHAPSVGFATNQPPIHSEEMGQLAPDPSDPTGPWSGAVQIDVPAGATALLIRLTPTAHGAAPALADLSLIVDTPSDGRFRVNNGGAGIPERMAWHGARDVAAAGAGTWHVTAQAQLDDPGILADAGFAVHLSAWTNATAERVAFQSTDDPIVRGQGHDFGWDLVLLEQPGVDEHVRIIVNGTAYFRHKPSSAAEDWGNFTKTVELPLIATPSGASLTSRVVLPAPGAPVGVNLARIGEAVGYATGFLMVGSLISGGILGKASRRVLNKVFGSAKRRVAFHNFTSYGLTGAALAHLVVFLVENRYAWTAGLLWGGGAFAALVGLGVTGALQIPLIRAWGYPRWRHVHLWAAVTAVALAIAHALLDGANFGAVQEAIGYQDPLAHVVDPGA